MTPNTQSRELAEKIVGQVAFASEDKFGAFAKPSELKEIIATELQSLLERVAQLEEDKAAINFSNDEWASDCKAISEACGIPWADDGGDGNAQEVIDFITALLERVEKVEKERDEKWRTGIEEIIGQKLEWGPSNLESRLQNPCSALKKWSDQLGAENERLKAEVQSLRSGVIRRCRHCGHIWERGDAYCPTCGKSECDWLTHEQARADLSGSAE